MCHCYKCVRHCAVKAIAVRDQQERIMVDHCITCRPLPGSLLPERPRHLPVIWSGVKGYLAEGCCSSQPPLSYSEACWSLTHRDRRRTFCRGWICGRRARQGAALVTNEYKKLVRRGGKCLDYYYTPPQCKMI